MSQFYTLRYGCGVMPVNNPNTWKNKVGTSGIQGKPQLCNKLEKKLNKRKTLTLYIQLNSIKI